MANLKSKFIFFWVVWPLVSCQTANVFEMKIDLKNELNVITVNTNRIIHECYFMNAEKENRWRHSYLLHILNRKNEVITVSYPINLDKEACAEHLKKVEKILRKESNVSLCVRDILKRDNRENPGAEIKDFGPLGKHSSPYDFLMFDSICNSKDCVSISDTWTYTCPGFKN